MYDNDFCFLNKKQDSIENNTYNKEYLLSYSTLRIL